MPVATAPTAPDSTSKLQARIVVVEDDHAQRTALVELFARDHRVLAAPNAAQALTIAEQFEPDLAIVDLGLPDLDGLELCRHLLARGCAVVVVTADAVEDRMIAALDLGAADYVVKPFSAGVLMARVRRALRAALDATSSSHDERIECGDVVIDLAARQVFVEGAEVDFQARHFTLLALLARNAGAVVTYKKIAHALWGDDTVDANLNSIRMSVNRIRQQLGTGPQRPTVETEPRIGYRLVVPA